MSIKIQSARINNPLEQVREIAHNYVVRGKLTKEEERAAVIIEQHRLGSCAKAYYDLLKQDKSSLTSNHRDILKKFSNMLEEKGINHKIIKMIKNIKTEGELNFFLSNFKSILDSLEFNPICVEAIKNRKGKGFLLEYEQLIYKKRCQFGDYVRDLFIMFAKPSTNPEVIKIENILKNEYGVETVLLNDDLIRARNILSSVKKLKANNMYIPNEYIVTDFKIGGIHLKTFGGLKSTVLLCSNKAEKIFESLSDKSMKCQNAIKEQILVDKWRRQCGFAKSEALKAKDHLETHEGVHGDHPLLFAYMFQKLENKYQATIKKISAYCATKPHCIHEVYAELKSMSFSRTLDDEEKILLKKIQFYNH